MNEAMNRTAIEEGRGVLGIELGSTRIKAVLINEHHETIAQGNHDWENRLENNIWTYSLDDIHSGVAGAYAALKRDVKQRYGVELKALKAVGISAMMHGYMPFDANWKLLTAFRTWRNTMTAEAAAELTERFQFNIPQRWSIAHLRQAMLNKEAHVPGIVHLTTLAGYIHYRLTGRNVLGVGEASGMFPIDSSINDYDAGMMAKFDELAERDGMPWRLGSLLPKVLNAGEDAGTLTEEGARFLDPEGDLQSGAALCPPEGDAGTGMTATNSVAARTGNVSAGTSVFSMFVTEGPLKKVHPEIDMVTTPTGRPVAMVHCNNCTSDLNAWVGLFGEYARLLGVEQTPDELYGRLYNRALEADADCGGLMACNFFAGEPVVDIEEGRPFFARIPDARFTLANFMRAHLYASLAVLKLGMDILLKEENVGIDVIYGHGGLFKTPVVGQRILAAAIDAPVSVMETAGEGGAWGVAVLAAYRVQKDEGESLEDYLNHKVFNGMAATELKPVREDVEGFNAWLRRFERALNVERAAIEAM